MSAVVDGSVVDGSVLGAVRIAEMLGQHRPTDEQVAVIEAPLEPLLVVAGAGSGKTETMAARVVYLIANGLVDAERVLGLTFTRKAAGELSERIRRRLRTLRGARGEDSRRSALTVPTVSTYNAYAAGLVGDHALRLGLEPSAQLLGDAGRWQLAHEVVEHWVDDLGVDLAPTTVTAAVLDLAGALAEHLVAPEDLRACAERLVDVLENAPRTEHVKADPLRLVREVGTSLTLRARLVDLVIEFTERKRAADAVDFADQVAIAARLACEVPEVGAGERARYGVVLLDEYQDTSVAQLELLRHLFGSDSGPGRGHPVTAVGDPHQAIYGWRGASAGGLARFPEHFPLVSGDPAPVLALATSWRNDRMVLEAANQVAAPLRAGAPIDLPELAARPGAGQGSVSARYLETVQDEARAVAEYVRDRREELTRLRATGAEGPVPVPTAAVLCRRRSQFPLLQAALLEAGLAVEVVGLGGLLSTPEVVDLVAALEAAHDPSRGDSLMRLLTGPRARLGLADLHALSDWSAELAGPRPERGTGEADLVDERSIVDALDELPPPGWTGRRGRGLTPEGRRRLEDLAGLLRALRAQTFLPVVDLVTEAEHLLGLDIEVAARPGVSPASARANLDAFRGVAASFSDSSDTGTLGAFLAWLDAAQREERGLESPVAEIDPEAVQLLTVHAAKGLEWDVVAVPGMVERTFPSRSKTAGWIKDNGALPTVLRGDRESLPDVHLPADVELVEIADRLDRYREEHALHHLSEERRLAYVALTRARHHLLLTGSWWREGTTPTGPSVFLSELTESLVPVDGVPDPRGAREDGTPGRATKPEDPAADPTLWPADRPLGPGRHERLDRAGRAVRDALDAGEAPDPGDPLAEVATMLLEERSRTRAARSTVQTPAHLSASALVRLAADPDGFALQLRRPVPLAPSAQARRGTAFHAWVEGYFGAAALVDVDTLPGADDDSVHHDVDLDTLRETFLASPWAARTPLAVEVDVETPVAGVMIRSRIDAVFADEEHPGGVVVVDWKTGRPPQDPAAAAHRELQLAVYRLAWSRWAGVPLEQVRAAFYYVAADVTVRPERLLDVEEIEVLLRS